MRLSAGTQLGSYEVVSLLGEGGMGAVYRGRDVKLRRDVALKFLSRDVTGDAEHKTRILAEARAAAALNHPGIATIYDVHDEGPSPFIVMELVEGDTLRTVASAGPLAPKVVVKLAIDLADGLAAAHAQGVVHGDVKPENVIRQADGRVKLLDFGVARPLAADVVTTTRTGVPGSVDSGVVAGTLAYMAPELIRETGGDSRTDLYSLGVLCYELLAGRRPFHGPAVAALVQQILDEPPPPLPGDVPAELGRIIRKLLEKSPDSRYWAAGDVRVDLANLARDLELGATLSAHVAGKRSVAVLPLRLMTPAAEDEYLSVALADAVINDLGAHANLLVRPTSAVMRFTNQAVDPLVAARELDVQVVVDGSVQRLGDQLRVQVRVQQAVDGAMLLTTKLDAPVSDLFGLQDRVAAAIGRALGATAVDDEPVEPPTRNARAYELYLRAMERISRPNQWDTRTAIEMLKNVTKMDPEFAAAWASLSNACLHMGNTFEPKPQWHRQAERAMEKALALDPENAEAHAARGRVLWSPPKGFQHRPALKAFGAALRLNPRSRQALTWRGLVLLHVGLHDAALDHLSEALASGPDDPLVIQFIAQVLWFEGRYGEAMEHHERSLSLDPVHLWSIIFSPGVALYQGDLERAERLIETGRQVVGPDALLTACEALLWAKRGELDRADTTLAHALKRQKTFLHEHHTLHTAVAVHALLGQPAEAMRQLRATAGTGFPNYLLFRDDPHLQSLREDAEYRALLEELRTDHEAYAREFGIKG